MSKVELISLTPDAEKTMAYIARVSNPRNQKNEDYSKLLSYCIKNEHWSLVIVQAQIAEFMLTRVSVNYSFLKVILAQQHMKIEEVNIKINLKK